MKETSPIAGLTLATYAAAKRFAVAFLKRLGLREVHLSGTPAVAIPYRNVDLIQEHALLHLASREVDEHGYTVAIFKDYECVRSLVHGLLMEGVERGVSNRLRETVRGVEDICAGKDEFKPIATISELSKR